MNRYDLALGKNSEVALQFDGTAPNDQLVRKTPLYDNLPDSEKRILLERTLQWTIDELDKLGPREVGGPIGTYTAVRSVSDVPVEPVVPPVMLRRTSAENPFIVECATGYHSVTTTTPVLEWCERTASCRMSFNSQCSHRIPHVYDKEQCAPSTAHTGCPACTPVPIVQCRHHSTCTARQDCPHQTQHQFSTHCRRGSEFVFCHCDPVPDSTATQPSTPIEETHTIVQCQDRDICGHRKILCIHKEPHEQFSVCIDMEGKAAGTNCCRCTPVPDSTRAL